MAHQIADCSDSIGESFYSREIAKEAKQKYLKKKKVALDLLGNEPQTFCPPDEYFAINLTFFNYLFFYLLISPVS